MLQTTGTTPMPHLAASYYSVHLDEAYFSLANSLGNVFIVKMGNLKVDRKERRQLHVLLTQLVTQLEWINGR